MKRNVKGSALVWSIVVVSVLAILIAGSLTITYSYFHRAIETSEQRQAYLTAKGVIEDIVGNIEVDNKEYLSLFMDTSKNKYTPLVDEGKSIPLKITLPTTDHIGKMEKESRININKTDLKESKGFITIVVVASYNEEIYSLKADMKLGRIDKKDKWQLIRYYQEDDIQAVSNNVTRGNRLFSEMSVLMKYYGENNYSSLLSMLQSGDYADYWKNYIKHFSEYTPKLDEGNLLTNWRFFDNSRMCYYFAFRTETGVFETFDFSELKKTTIIDPLTKKSINIEQYKVDNKGTTLFSQIMTIQPHFLPSLYTSGFVYASPDAPAKFMSKLHLFYYDDHWYFIDKVMKSDVSVLKRDLNDNISEADAAVEINATSLDRTTYTYEVINPNDPDGEKIKKEITMSSETKFDNLKKYFTKDNMIQ